MAIPKVTVNNLNLLQGEPTAIEGYFLFIGHTDINKNQIIAVNSQSDFDTLLGTENSSLKTQLIAARQNANSDWSALVATLDTGDTWLEAVGTVMKKNYNVEALVICDPVEKSDDIVTMHALAMELLNSFQRRLFVMACTTAIDDDSQTWSDYLTKQRTLVDGLEAGRVMVVPLLFANALGILAGRLAHSAVSVADSPIRVLSGPLIGVTELPLDVNGEPLNMAIIEILDKARFSVPCWFADYEGYYWADGNLVAAQNSDYKVIEHLRVVDKAARRIRPLLIADIGNRRLNNTAASMEWAKTRYMAPLRAMAKPVTMNSQQLPGDIKPPKGEHVAITFLSLNKVAIYFTLVPYNSPKQLEGNISLDLSIEEHT